ncbi:unnamed protein product [Boreogadus saida]
MSRKKLAWANKEVETFVCILGEEDVVYDVYVAAAAIDIRPTTKAVVRVPPSRGGALEGRGSRGEGPSRGGALEGLPEKTLQHKAGKRTQDTQRRNNNKHPEGRYRSAVTVATVTGDPQI